MRPNDCSAGILPAVSGASRPRFGEVTIRDRGRLPHWELEGGVYFVTFRLADSLPQSVVKSFVAERDDIVETARRLGRDLSTSERKRLAELFSERVESYLDAGKGSCHLANPRVAGLVADALRHFDGKRYRLFAWCIMPNHVHVVVKPFPNYSLAEVIHSWKPFTAKKANRVLERTGAFWQREYYDHLVRGEEDLHRVVHYVLENPSRAKLKDWPWVWVCGQDARTTAGVPAGATTVSL